MNNSRKMSANEKMLVFLCSAIYFVSYITRINYAAIIVEFAASTGLGEEQASFALTGLAIFYGAGQLLSGYLGDKIKPKVLISAGLATSAAMNFILPFSIFSVPLLTALWCVNGLAQAMMWPPIVRILTASLSNEKYKRSAVKVSVASQLATIIIYLGAPLCIRFAGWQPIFFAASACAALMSVVVAIKLPDISTAKAPLPSSEKTAPSSGFRIPVILFGSIMLAIVLQGIMRDGVTNWLPSYIKSEYGVSSEIAIMLGVVPPVFAMLCYEFTSFLSRKVFKNEMICSMVLFGAAFSAAFVLSFFHNSSIALSVALGTLITGCMHGVNIVLITIIPQYFSKTGRVAFISGLLNSCTYIGSALSGYGFAAVSAKFGWNGTISVWAIICFAATALCLACAPVWKKFSRNDAA
ncbi:MAG: MFS transporter [Clostridia bacterium]|nr:MFS transporter [Clostridia bacterium]